MANNFEQTSATTRLFTLEFLKQITDNFSEDHIIGRGGYGVVYKGVLETGEEIALKKLYYVPGFDDTQFRNEFNNLMRLQHPNITRLVGYCYFQGHERIKLNNEYVFAHLEERVLCFEYLHGGSLDTHISDESCGLEWHTRFKIIKGVCEGLNYLHNGSKDPIYHLDLKPANILLDKNMVPKIGDFGLSRLFPSTQTYVTIKIIGTPGYMPPEYIERHEITSKFDVFSLGVIIIRIMAGEEGYSRLPQMSSEEFLDHVHENWTNRLQESMSLHISNQVMTCIGIALRCVEVNREERPTISDIVDELNIVDIAENSPSGEVANFRTKHDLNQTPNAGRGTIVFSATYRPPVAFDIFSCPVSPSSTDDELNLTDGVSYNYNGRPIPSAALKNLLKNPKLTEECSATDADVDAGHVSGLIFVSERDDGLETLYIALRFNSSSKVKVFALADIFGTPDFSGARLEDSGCIGGGFSVGSLIFDHSLIYVSTKEPSQVHRKPWTIVYKTDLTTGYTERLTPKDQIDLSPAVSPSGKTVAVANFRYNRWKGETENLVTDIILMNADRRMGGLRRRIIIKDGGWPSWGSENILFFHRGTQKSLQSGMVRTAWAVFRYDVNTKETVQVTPDELDAVTPAGISETKVAVATIRQMSEFGDVRMDAQYRHIEIFDMSVPGLPPVQITQKIRPKSDHYNPFVMDGGARIGYHRCRSGLLQQTDHVPLKMDKVESPDISHESLLPVSGMLPTISKDGSKLAFVDSDFKAVWVADSQGLRIVHQEKGPNSVFSPVWNQNPSKDTLYFCVGPSLCATKPLEIYSIRNASSSSRSLKARRITYGGFNNAFPSSSPDGNRFVFRSTRGGGEEKHKNLYIMMQTDSSGNGEGWVTRLTKGQWTDTRCQWSPNGDWIIFSSTRSWGTEELDPGYFSLYLVKATDPTVLTRVINGMGGYINHPVFSPDGRSIALTTDLAAVSVEPISLPKFMHAVRPYGDIFVVDIVDPSPNSLYDDDDLTQNEDVKSFTRVTHSRYECGTPAWTNAKTKTNAPWNMFMDMKHPYRPACPYVHPDGCESSHMTGHLCVPDV